MMQRSYSRETRKLISQVLRNALRANRSELIRTPGCLAEIASLLRIIAVKSEPDEELEQVAGTWFDESSCFLPSGLLGDVLLDDIEEHFLEAKPTQQTEPAEVGE